MPSREFTVCVEIFRQKHTRPFIRKSANVSNKDDLWYVATSRPVFMMLIERRGLGAGSFLFQRDFLPFPNSAMQALQICQKLVLIGSGNDALYICLVDSSFFQLIKEHHRLFSQLFRELCNSLALRTTCEVRDGLT